jgi:hypothetical protein
MTRWLESILLSIVRATPWEQPDGHLVQNAIR